MFIQGFAKLVKSFEQKNKNKKSIKTFLGLISILVILAISTNSHLAQSPVNGGFEGRVTENGAPLSDVLIQFINRANGFRTAKRTNADGYFRQTMLQPGVYTIRAVLDGYKTVELTQNLFATRSNSIVPVPIQLVKESSTTTPTTTPTPVTSTVSNISTTQVTKTDTEAGGNLNPRRDGAFDIRSLLVLPLGGNTFTRSFDELAFLTLGVAPPPQAIGNSVGPGVGGGVGTSGQFSVNGMRSRANNFLVDGADNNDEDIGVRRQGFFALVPQPIESIQEFQIITLLAPAEFGRNIGGQVNALSKSGGNSFHGTVYGMFNSDKLNAREFFDNDNGDTTIPLTALQGGQFPVPVRIDGQLASVTNDAGEKDEFNLLQGGFAVGGPIAKNKLFFFASGEIQRLDATRERNFAVPTVEQRGLFNSGATGLQQCQGASVVNGVCLDANNQPIDYVSGFPTSDGGDAVFSLFPFANNPNGIYGRNTYSQTLSADADGQIFSGKIDYNLFTESERPQLLTVRYNYTDDSRDLTDVGGAIFSGIRPIVRTDNVSTYLTGAITNNLSNEFRFSWGRTRLKFEELPDPSGFLVPVSSSLISSQEERRFLLNAPTLLNTTLPVCFPTGCVAPTEASYITSFTTENTQLGPIGQLIVAGFSPVGVDVFNFPQERKNNTYQFANTMRLQSGTHSVSFGVDVRGTTLESNLPRNSRPLVTFNGGLVFNDIIPDLARPSDLAASGAATGFFQSLVLSGKDANIKLDYNQLNFFAQDEWRARSNLTLNFGLRYEYNTVPKEADNKIESTFSVSNPSYLSGLDQFINGRTKIFDSDKNNFAPRFGVAWSPDPKSVIRAGFGMFYDQIIGAVVSQSRNVFPTFTTANFGGGFLADNNGVFSLFNPFNAIYDPTIGLVCNLFGLSPCDRNNSIFLLQPGRLNEFNSNLDQQNLDNALLDIFTNFPVANGSPFGATLPARDLETPMSYQYSVGFEQELANNTFLSIAYVGSTGRKLLKFTTPNLGTNYIAGINFFNLENFQPQIFGTTFDPFTNPNDLTRPNPNIGSISQFETTGRSSYNSLQLGFRGILSRKLQYQLNYVFSNVQDDVSDVFDLAGAFALPQNSLTEAGEYADANFDVRHRFTYSFVYDLPSLKSKGGFAEFIFGNWIVSGTGKYHSGQPFTVNSIFDINFDGNLTDRLNNTRFIIENDSRQQPLDLVPNANLASMLAPFGTDGSVLRNSFRAGGILELDVSFLKRFVINESQAVVFRTDIFNFVNRANFGIPVRFLEAPGFGRAVDTITPGRRVQFALKYVF